MAKEKLIAPSPRERGTIGHIDHGKTTLTAASQGVAEAQSEEPVRSFDSIDNAPEERERDHDRDAHVEYETRTVTMRTSIAGQPIHQEHDHGAAQMDGAILVVAATDGPMRRPRSTFAGPQWCSLRLVFLNKCDASRIRTDRPGGDGSSRASDNTSFPATTFP